MGDKIPGGLAKGKSLQDIAKHHKVPTKYIISALEKGIQVEKEHTTDESVAREIAMDHLWEDPKYYNKLEKVEKLDEGKNIGNLYHFTSFYNLISILKIDILKDNAYTNTLSLTRDKNLWRKDIMIGGSNVRVVIDGNKLSENHKIEPFNDNNYSFKGHEEERRGDFEAEEKVKGPIENLDKYVISYDVEIPVGFEYDKYILRLLDQIYTLSLNNPKIKFYYKGDQVSFDILKQQFKQVAAETKSKADKYGIESYARELAQGLEEILTEGKNIGVLYHFTSPLAAQLILKQNKIKSYGVRFNKPYISFTRNKDLYKQRPSIGGVQVRLVLDGNKLSEKYKIQPHDYLGGDRESFAISGYSISPFHKNLINKSDKFEAEEAVISKEIDNLDKYLISIDLIDPIDWTSISAYDYFFKEYDGKIPLRVIDKDGKITDTTSYEKQLIAKSKLAEYQNQKILNPNLWENNKLKQKYKEGLRKIAQYFIDKIDLKPKIDDIVLTGSSANYNWTQYSDVDLHILLDFSQFKDPELSKKYFDQLKNNWNREFDLKIGNNEIELYFQDTNEPHAAMGVYSLLQDKWLKEPTQENVEVSDEEIQNKAIPFKQQIDSLQELSPEEALPQIEKLKEKVRRFRKCGLETGGEYSVENLAFKELRNSGYLEKINLIKKDDEQKELSSFINESKNIGTLYHLTHLNGLLNIIKDNALIDQGSQVANGYISFTRDKNLRKYKGLFLGPPYGKKECRITIDGTKLSENYKIEPYNFYGGMKYSSRPNSKGKNPDEGEFEAEERVKSPIKHLDKYVISYDVFLDSIDPEYYGKEKIFEKIDKFYTIKNNPKVKFYYKDKQVNLDEFLNDNFSDFVKKQVAENQQFPNSHKIIKTLVKRITKFLLDKGLKIEPLPKVKFIYNDLVNAKNSLGRTAHYDFDRAYITLYTRYRHPKDVVRSFVHEIIHHEQKLAGKIKNITTTNINDDDNLKELEREAYEKGNMLFREWENSLDKEKLQLNENYPSEYFDNKYGTKLSHKWNGEELLNVDEIRNWQKIKSRPLTKEQLDKIDNLYNQIITKNPELKKLSAKDYQEKIDILHGVESRFNIDDIEYFLSDEHQNSTNYDEETKSYPSLKRSEQISKDLGVSDHYWVMSPKTLEKAKAKLNETPYEDNHPEIKYWALYANIFGKLKKNPEGVYQILKDKLKGEQLKALNYFYPMAKDPSLLKEAKNIGPLYHFTRIDNLFDIIEDNELKPRYAKNLNYDRKKLKSFDKNLGGDGFFISFTRNKNFNKQIRDIKGTGCRITIDGNKLSENYKISPKVALDSYSKEKPTFEYEERVNDIIKPLDKYVISYDIFVDKAEGENVEDENNFNLYKKFINLLTDLSTNSKVKFYLGNKEVSWEKIQDYYGLNQKKQVAAEQRLYNLALRKDPEGLTWLGASVLKDVLEEIQPKEKIKYDKWVLPSEDDLKREYKVEHKIKGRNEFPTEESFLKAIKNAQPEEITPEKDKSIDYRVQTKDYDELLSLIKTFKSYPQYRNEETLKSLYKKIKNNQPLDMPIVMEYSDGSRRILSGNTRMNVAFQLGVNPKVLIVKVPDKNLNENVDKQELKTVELQADRELSPIDVKFSDHFFERVNDPRNEKEIHVEDLFDFFDHLTNHKDQLIAFLKKYRQIVVKDKKNQINIPFVKVADKILAKTIMVKKNFLTQDPQLVMEGKQVGILYHFTDLYSLKDIIKDNKLNKMYSKYVSFTRDKNFWKEGGQHNIIRSISGNSSVRLSIDGDKLSDNYKIKPYSFYRSSNLKIDSLGDVEAEERVEGSIDNLDKYVISYDVILDKLNGSVIKYLEILEELLKEKNKLRFIYKDKQITLDDWNEYLNSLHTRSFVAESKQVGDVYHFTSLSNFLQILADNKIKTGDIYMFGGDNSTISTTRDKNFISRTFKSGEGNSISGDQIGIMLDGNKLSDKFKVRPYNYSYDQGDPRAGDEQEELFYGKKINQQGGIRNLNKYIKGIIFTPKFSWEDDFIIPEKYINLVKEYGLEKIDIPSSKEGDYRTTDEISEDDKKEIFNKIVKKELPGIKIDYQK